MDNNFAFNLKHIRQEKGLTQKQLGKLMNKDYSTIGKWENGTRSPIMEDVIKLSDILQIDIKDLIGKDFMFDKKKSKPSTFHHTDKESGLSVEIIPTEDVDWNSLSKDEQEGFISMAMDALYEAKKEIKNDKKVGENKNE